MYKVLIVDDNKINLKLASKLLEVEGYDVIPAYDGMEAMKKLEENHVDLILMDIGLPDIDGLTLTKQLKSHETYNHIPIIVVTASAMKGDDEKAYDAGCDAYITKPIDSKELVEKSTAILEEGMI